MKTKTGEKISLKEALKRFKQGVADISPQQKLENDMRGTLITIMGFIVALGACIWQINTIGLLGYGLILIFFGNIITTGLKYIAMRQQLKYFKQTDGSSIDISNLLDKIDEGKAKEYIDKLNEEKEVK